MLALRTCRTVVYATRTFLVEEKEIIRLKQRETSFSHARYQHYQRYLILFGQSVYKLSQKSSCRLHLSHCNGLSRATIAGKTPRTLQPRSKMITIFECMIPTTALFGNFGDPAFSLLPLEQLELIPASCNDSKVWILRTRLPLFFSLTRKFEWSSWQTVDTISCKRWQVCK